MRTAERSFRALSFGFRFRSEVPEAVDAVDHLLAPFAVPSRDRAAGDVGPLVEIVRTGRRFEVLVDAAVAQRTETLGTAVGWVAWKSSLEALETTDRFLALHAGAVANGDRAILLPAPPDSGKTTLTAALVRAGFRYLSDEAALLDPSSGEVHPFPRALAMDASSMRVLGVNGVNGAPGAIHHLTVGDLGGTLASTPCRVWAVVFPTYRPGAQDRLEPVGRAETVVALAENAFNAARFGAGGVRLLADVVAGARCARLTMDDIDEAVATVEGVLEA
jgi:hypothetical protein